MPRLRRSNDSKPGIVRRRRGRGFSYTDAEGNAVDDEAAERIRALAIPPAWESVWICPDPRGHLQATGIDAAGRKQYLYHERWRVHRDRQKFARMEEFGRRLPRVRRRVAADLKLRGAAEQRVHACTVRLLDQGLFRIGTSEYAESNGTYGVSTLLSDHVAVRGDVIGFEYLAKGGIERELQVTDGAVARVLRLLKRHREDEEQLLAFRCGREWRELRSDSVNDYLRQAAGFDCSAKDFRTWHATVLAAHGVAQHAESPGDSKAAKKRIVSAVTCEVADLLGNTPTVCRTSYIDPRVFDRFSSGLMLPSGLGRGCSPVDCPPRVRRRIELAVLDLLG
jgi:DNA topoisomerase IB